MNNYTEIVYEHDLMEKIPYSFQAAVRMPWHVIFTPMLALTRSDPQEVVHGLWVYLRFVR